MKPFKYLEGLEKQIRGWLPKDSVTLYLRKMSKPIWWRQFLPLLIISVTVLIVAQVTLFLLAYINLSTFFGGVLITILTIPLAYTIWHIQTRYQLSKTIQIANKIAFILAGACLAFPITFFAVVFILGAESLTILSNYIGYWPTIILLLAVPMIVGAFIGYWLGKRRNYRPYR